jgi:hypothetical protein
MLARVRPHSALALVAVLVGPSVSCGSRTDLPASLARVSTPTASADAGAGGGGIGGHAAGGHHAGGEAPGGGGPGGQGPGGGGPGGAGGAAGAGAGGQDTGQLISESADSVMEAETHLAVTPAGVAAVAWISIPAGAQAAIGTTFSLDGGATWTPPIAVSSPDGRDASDPVLVVEPAGGFYLTWVGFYRDGAGNPSDMHVYVAHAPIGATSFGAPVAVSAPDPNAFYDKPWIAMTSKGTAVVTYSRQSGSELSLVAARSTDGQSWQESIIATDPFGTSYRNLAYPCASRNADRLYVTYPRAGQFGVEAISLAWSDDQGATWSSEMDVANAPQEPLAYEDPTCVAEGDDLWISYGLSQDPPAVESTALLDAIRVVHSKDAGASVDVRLYAHDVAAGQFYLLPAMTREDDGSLDVLYYAGDGDGQPGTIRRARMPAGAGAFGPSVVVDAPLTFNVQRSSPLWLGDYVGLAWRGGRLYMAYARNDLGTSHIAFAAASTP